MSDLRLQKTLELIDAVNQSDPNTTVVDNIEVANEVLYSMRMSETLCTFRPDASELLQIAARAQHIERWISPRTDFPEGRTGYKKWRSSLAMHHAKKTAELMQTAGYAIEQIERVKYLLLKRGLKTNDETQCLEDVICLVFLKYYLEDFVKKHSEEKLIVIIQKTWSKMSDIGHEHALKLTLNNDLSNLLQKALH